MNNIAEQARIIVNKAADTYRIPQAERDKIKVSVIEKSGETRVQLGILCGTERPAKPKPWRAWPRQVHAVRWRRSASRALDGVIAVHRYHRGIAARAVAEAEREIRKLGYQVDVILYFKFKPVLPASEHYALAASVAKYFKPDETKGFGPYRSPELPF